MRPRNGAGTCLKRSAGIQEKSQDFWEGILCIHCKNSLKVFTGSRIVSPIAIFESRIFLLYLKRFDLLLGVVCCESVLGQYGSMFHLRRNVLCFWLERVVLVWSSL